MKRIAGVAGPRRLRRAPKLSTAMAQRYFDVDMIVTLGALALASGAFVAAGIAGSRRRVRRPRSPRRAKAGAKR